MADPPLDLTCHRLPEATVLHLRGHLVAANVDRLELSLAVLLTQLRRPLVIDLAGVLGHDRDGLAVLAGVARAAPPATPVRLTGLHGDLLTLVDKTAAIAGIPVFASVQGAATGDASDLVLPRVHE